VQNGIGGTTPNGNIYFTVNGQEHINLSIPGVGGVEITSTPIQIKGIFNPCSGNYSITVTQK